ncbi:NRDE family protein [uncultured Psychrobacter sp.]|uniref:NRDE family protein n=1 Tax=uncultured Psychrobacter sp. TaxID=259303 RepID=UPI0034585036
MCIVAIAWQLFEELPLVLLSNRDEFLARPTEPLYQWKDLPVYAGRDSRSGGTWLGIHQQKQSTTYQQNGRWAAVLNFRDGVQASANERSRGELVTDFLTSDLSPMAFARQIRLQDYAGFNLIIGDNKQAVVVNNRGYAPTPLHAGLHVFSNGQPEEGWFKTEKLRSRLRQEVLPLIAEKHALEYWQQAAFAVMSDDTPAPPDQLPNTGIASEIEQALSSIYIDPVELTQGSDNVRPNYGTRTQSILTLRHDKTDTDDSAIKTYSRANIISREFEQSLEKSDL